MAALMISICTVIIAFYIVFDLFPLFKERHLKEFWIYTVLISFAYVIHIFLALDYKLPSPADAIKKLVQHMFGIQ